MSSSTVLGTPARKELQANGPKEPMQVRVASHRSDREAAFRLIYDNYVSAGLATANRHAMRLLPHHLLSTTDLFVARQHGQTVATITLIRDGELPLPIESVYAHETAELHRKGKVLAEVSCLADQGKKTLPNCMELFRLMVQTARARGVDTLVVAVHPKHARFYERWLAFERIGGEAMYPSVCDNPAVALALDFERIDRERPVNYQRFFGCPINPALLQPCPMLPEDRFFFRKVLNASEDQQVGSEVKHATGSPVITGLATTQGMLTQCPVGS